MDTAIFTICSANYLQKAVTLMRSSLSANPELQRYIIIADTKRKLWIHDNVATIIWCEDIDISSFQAMAFIYNIIEFNTSIKPFVALHLLETHAKLIYLDPDVYIFSDITCVVDQFVNGDIILSPHICSPYTDNLRPSELDLLRFGTYNLGFFAIINSVSSVSFLKWWASKCIADCYYEPSGGLAVDQKWVDLVPAMFDRVYIFRNLGINFAFWNLHERLCVKQDNQWLLNSGEPLIFVHFSSFDAKDSSVVAKKQNRYPPSSRYDFTGIATEYISALSSSIEYYNIEGIQYGYSRFSNGALIDEFSRKILRHYIVSSSPSHSPFDITKGKAYKFLRNRGIYSVFRNKGTNRSHEILEGANLLRIVNFTDKFIAPFLYILLLFLGPRAYLRMLKYFQHISQPLVNSSLIFRLFSEN